MLQKVTDAPDFVAHGINLASAGLGAEAVYATDEFFAPLSRMLSDAPAVFIADKYDDNGKWMDGWESRRKRGPGHDFSIVKLAVPGRILGFDVDTSHFIGNYPPACRIEAARVAGTPDEATEWVELVPQRPLGPGAHHYFAATSDAIWTHVRLHIHPDGGVARLRVYGEPELDRSAAGDRVVDLASSLAGGRIVAFSDAHFGDYRRLLAPGRGLDMGDGWETRRRRQPGNDWIIVRLAARGLVESVLVDTAHYKGNYPHACSIQAADLGAMTGGLNDMVINSSMFWDEILPQQMLAADTVHEFAADKVISSAPVTHVRLNIYPDGGVSRLRINGRLV
ncbi:allantoicase [Pararhizobium haloflavum]|uniref:allantoicase n=1 Tax=Pararhizobium haloflavum TaxID=2037914 RepID=UPI000C197BEF|nr:allantoicase [Pararhizobium haloflavum]